MRYYQMVGEAYRHDLTVSARCEVNDAAIGCPSNSSGHNMDTVSGVWLERLQSHSLFPAIYCQIWEGRKNNKKWHSVQSTCRYNKVETMFQETYSALVVFQSCRTQCSWRHHRYIGSEAQQSIWPEHFCLERVHRQRRYSLELSRSRKYDLVTHLFGTDTIKTFK